MKTFCVLLSLRSKYRDRSLEGKYLFIREAGLGYHRPRPNSYTNYKARLEKGQEAFCPNIVVLLGVVASCLDTSKHEVLSPAILF